MLSACAPQPQAFPLYEPDGPPQPAIAERRVGEIPGATVAELVSRQAPVIGRSANRGAGGEPLTLEFEAARAIDVARTVFSDHLGYGVVTVGALATEISWRSDGLGPEAAVSALEAALSASGYGVSYADQVVVISEQSAGEARSDGYLFLRSAIPSSVAEAVQSAIPEVSVATSGRAVIISGQGAAVRSALRLASALDIDELASVPWAIVRLPKTVVLEAANLVTALSWYTEGGLAELHPMPTLGLVFVAGFSETGVRTVTHLLRSIANELGGSVARSVQVSGPLEMAEAVTSLFSAELDAGDVAVHPLEAQSALSLRGTPRAVADVMEYIRSVQVDDEWVSVRAIIAETQVGSSVDRGVTVGLNTSQFQLGFGLGGTDPATITDGRALSVGVSAGEFTAALAWLEADATTLIVSQPTLSVRSGATASLNVGSSVPVLEAQVTDTDDGGSITQAISYRDTGVVLSVTPRILRDGRIGIEVGQETSQAVSNTFSTVDSPVFDTRALTTDVVVHSGEMAVLAGLDSRSYTTNNSGIALDWIPPVLASSNNSNTRVYIFITVERLNIEQRQVLTKETLSSVKNALKGA